MDQNGNQEHARGSTNHAKRNEPRLDEVLGIVRRDDGAHHEASHGESEVILQGVDGLRSREVLEHEGEHLGHGPEHRKGDNGGTQGAVTPAEAQAAAGHGELDVFVFVADLRNKEACDGAEHAYAGKNPRDDDGLFDDEADRLVADDGAKVDEVHAHDGKPARNNDTDEGENLEEGVGVAQVMDAEHLAHNRVLGGTVDGKTAAEANRKPEGYAREVACDKHGLRNHESRHEQGGPRENLVLGEPVGEEPGGPDHQHVGRDKEYLEHEGLPGLAAFGVGEGT